ncbi:hypothetical protein KM043_017793 [Ampulex compressa]|nr:hypothetical protein KM043_017793 [Ampulex compressa]
MGHRTKRRRSATGVGEQLTGRPDPGSIDGHAPCVTVGARLPPLLLLLHSRYPHHRASCPFNGLPLHSLGCTHTTSLHRGGVATHTAVALRGTAAVTHGLPPSPKMQQTS